MADLYIYGDIGYDVMATDVVSVLDSLGTNEPLDVRISSAGGHVFEGFTIANRIRAHQGPVTAHIDGLAASMATVIALAADRVVMAEDAWFMIHNPQAMFAQGEADELRRQADTMDSVAERMAAVYRAKTGSADIEAWMDAETWFTAQEALQVGFVDEISEPRAVLAAHANFLKLERFQHPPKRESENPMKTKLGIALAARLDSLATDDEARKSLIAQIAEASNSDTTSVEMLIEGSLMVPPTEAHFAAFGRLLGLLPDDLQAKAAEDWPEIKQAIEANDPTPNINALHTEEGRAMERRRMLELTAMFEKHPGNEDLLQTCLRNGTSVDAAARLLLNARADQVQPISGGGVASSVPGEDRRDKFIAACTASILGRTDTKYRERHKDDLARNEFSGHSLRDMARYAVELAGHYRPGMDIYEIVGLSFTSSDLKNILADVANKSMMVGFNEHPETWQQWAQIGNLQDFKPHKRAALSEFDDLLEINNGSEEYKRGEFTDLSEDIKLVTYGRLFSITRQTIINDDMGAFTGIPTGMGRAAARKIGDLAYGLLINGDTMQDGNNTYDAANNNTLTDALSEGSLNDARTTMATQPGILNKEKAGTAGAEALNIMPAYLLLPHKIFGEGLALMESQNWTDAGVAEGAAASTRPNIVRGMATPIADARLDAADDDQWFILASPMMHPTLEIGFLNGNPNPRLEQQNQFTTDGVDFKVSIDAGGKWLDYRGVVKSTPP